MRGAALYCGATHFWGNNEFSVQFSRSVVSDSLRPHGLQHTRLPCPSPTQRKKSGVITIVLSVVAILKGRMEWEGRLWVRDS